MNHYLFVQSALSAMYLVPNFLLSSFSIIWTQKQDKRTLLVMIYERCEVIGCRVWYPIFCGCGEQKGKRWWSGHLEMSMDLNSNGFYSCHLFYRHDITSLQISGMSTECERFQSFLDTCPFHLSSTPCPKGALPALTFCWEYISPVQLWCYADIDSLSPSLYCCDMQKLHENVMRPQSSISKRAGVQICLAAYS